MCNRIYLWSHLVLGLCLLEFLKSVSFQYLLLVNSYFLSSWSSLLKLYLSRNCSVLQGCPPYWLIPACPESYDTLYLCRISCNFFFFPNFIYLSHLFFLDDSGYRFINLLIFSKNEFLVSLIFVIFFISILVTSDLIFMISFLVLTLSLFLVL